VNDATLDELLALVLALPQISAGGTEEPLFSPESYNDAIIGGEMTLRFGVETEARI
jgi:hypothetical protein